MPITFAPAALGARAGACAGILACLLAGITTGHSSGLSAQEQPFHLACSTLPFETIKKARDIDDHCDVAGDADLKTEAPHAKQNTAKNNFCASGAPVPVTNFTFRRLQQIVDQRTDIECCGQTLPSNRALLQDLHTTSDNHHVGEGTVVQMIGFLIKGKYSNVGKGKGESVNCHFEDREENDIHMNIVKSKPPANPTKTQLETLECESVVAEVSPHFRPELWEPLGRLVKTTAKATAAKKIAALDLDRPMRFTGQAFFDASHRPCINGKPQESSKRVSSWEIHPVYQVEVCANTSLSGCAPDRSDVWVSLNEWLTADEDEDGDSGDVSPAMVRADVPKQGQRTRTSTRSAQSRTPDVTPADRR